MQDFSSIYQNESRFLALTSLKTSEFANLLACFSPICEKYFAYHDFSGKKRKFQRFSEIKGNSLYGSDAKLFFILTYLNSIPCKNLSGLCLKCPKPR